MLAKLDLNGVWELKPVERFDPEVHQSAEGWLQQQLPAHWQQLPELERHAGKVVYRRRFRFSPSPGLTYRLRLNGVFYWSTVYLNGQRLGANEGYFMPCDYDVTGGLAVDGDNLLVVEVDCPDEKRKNRKRMITGVFSHWDGLDPETNPGGIWLPVELLSAGASHFTRTRLALTDFYARVARVRIDLAAAGAPGRYRWRLRLTPTDTSAASHSVEGEIAIGAGPGETTADLVCPDYRLWWTHDTGPQHLYRAEFELTDTGGQTVDRAEFDWGMRLFTLNNYHAYLNKRRLFIRGNNYPPGDTRLATMTAERAMADLRLAKNCNMNLLRLHAHIDHPAIYDAADQEGVLLWQDFPLQWQYAKRVLPEAVRQAGAMVDLLGNHPSLAVWCMHNEPLAVIDTKDESTGASLRALRTLVFSNWNRNVLDTRLQREVQRLDPSRFTARSSGELPLFGKGGDTHFYFGWYHSGKRTFDRIRVLLPKALRFVTEFGAQSFPNRDSAARFMATDIEKVDWARLAARHSFQPEIMAHWYDWRACRSLDDLIELTQSYQIELNRYYIDRLRFHKYRPTGGIVPFMFHDPNPAVQWSILDYWRVPKRSYDAMRLNFAPVYAFALLWKDEYQAGETVNLAVYVVNDTWQMASFQVRARLVGPDGREIMSRDSSVRLEPDSPTYAVDTLTTALPEGTSVLTITWQHNGEELVNTYTLSAVAPAPKR